MIGFQKKSPFKINEFLSDLNQMMYIVVNSDLQMSKGKAIAQCCHCVCDVVRRLENQKTENYRVWMKEGQKKVVVKATQKQLEALLDEYVNNVFVWCKGVHDAGLTQVPENSLTCVVFCPLDSSQVPDILKKLKLL